MILTKYHNEVNYRPTDTELPFIILSGIQLVYDLNHNVTDLF